MNPTILGLTIAKTTGQMVRATSFCSTVFAVPRHPRRPFLNSIALLLELWSFPSLTEPYFPSLEKSFFFFEPVVFADGT